MLRVSNTGLTAAVLKTLLPRSVGRYLRSHYQNAMFTYAMRSVLSKPVKELLHRRELVGDLIYGWGNEEWSGLDEYLLACVDHASKVREPILECGSGLSTLLLGLAARESGTQVWSLEHHPEWGRRVQRALDRFGIDSVELCVAPLKDYGEYSWYEPPLEAMPERFGLVACDGPPESTRGGRYGLLPVMNHRFGPRTRILLDDAERDGEKAVLERWARETPLTYELAGTSKPYFVISLQAGPILS